MGDQVEIDDKIFQDRINNFITQWKNDTRAGKDSLFGGASSIVVCLGKASDGTYNKSIAFQVSPEMPVDSA